MENIKNYEKYVLELEKIVESFETDGLTLDKSLKNFQKGIEVYRKCQEILNQVEENVKIIQGEQEINYGIAREDLIKNL